MKYFPHLKKKNNTKKQQTSNINKYTLVNKFGGFIDKYVCPLGSACTKSLFGFRWILLKYCGMNQSKTLNNWSRLYLISSSKYGASWKKWKHCSLLLLCLYLFSDISEYACSDFIKQNHFCYVRQFYIISKTNINQYGWKRNIFYPKQLLYYLNHMIAFHMKVL